jgi:hypothetical protein
VACLYIRVYEYDRFRGQATPADTANGAEGPFCLAIIIHARLDPPTPPGRPEIDPAPSGGHWAFSRDRYSAISSIRTNAYLRLTEKTMRVVLNLTEGQIADICAQLLPKAKPAAKAKARPMTEHRRN